MLSIAGITAGIILLIAGGALLVRGASEIAASLGVSPMVIGLTVVGFGTSSPELVVNVMGALNGATELAFGNVVGSNISNLGLILGIAAIIAPIAIQGGVVRRELPLLLLVTTMMTVMALDGPLQGMPAIIGRSDSVVLMLMFCIFVYITVIDVMGIRQQDKLLIEVVEHPGVVTPAASRFQWLLVAVGVVLLFVGGEMTIRYGVALSTELGVPAAVVGLFVVAIGTSMPELATSIIAAIKKESDLALGNIIGSNIFNSLVVLPASGVVAAIKVPEGGVGDLVVSWVFAALLVPIFYLRRGRLGRGFGVLLIAGYLAYAVYRVTAI
jgi:cation:H+ antiporter